MDARSCFTLPKGQCIYKWSFCSNHKPLPIPKHSTARFYMRDNAEGRKAGMLSLVVCGLPICLPLALAFAIPDRSLEQPCPPGSPA